MLSEALSDIVFHATSLEAAWKILNKGEFRLSASYGWGDEAKFAPSNSYRYYMSVTRSVTGAYHSSWENGVIFKLNGRAFNNRYRSRSVDFFAAMSDPGDGKGNEFEDRIFSSTNSIKLVPGMIQSVNILADEVYSSPGKKVYLAAKRAGLETHLWKGPENHQAWKSLDISKETTPEKMGWNKPTAEYNTNATPFGSKPWRPHQWSYITSKIQGDFPKHGKFSDRLMDRLYLWRELWYKKSWESLSEYSKEALRDHFTRSKGTHDWLRRFQSDYSGQGSRKDDFGTQGTIQMDKILKGKDPDMWAIEMYHKWKLIIDQVGI